MLKPKKKLQYLFNIRDFILSLQIVRYIAKWDTETKKGEKVKNNNNYSMFN